MKATGSQMRDNAKPLHHAMIVMIGIVTFLFAYAAHIDQFLAIVIGLTLSASAGSRLAHARNSAWPAKAIWRSVVISILCFGFLLFLWTSEAHTSRDFLASAFVPWSISAILFILLISAQPRAETRESQSTGLDLRSAE